MAHKQDIKHFDLSDIKDPGFVKNCSFKELNVLASDIREEIIKQTSIYGGHLSSNLGVVELTIALHYAFDAHKDKFIFDVGHQCYTHKILTGRSLDHLRQKDCVSGYQRMNESSFDCFEAGHSSTSISAALGFAVSRDLNNENYDVISIIGDASIVSGLAFEGLNNLGHNKHKVIIVLNDNGMAISHPVGGISSWFAQISTAANYNRMKASYKSHLSKTKCGTKFLNFTRRIKNKIRSWLVPSTIFDDMGLTYIGPVDGHNIKALVKAFKRSKNTRESTIIHVITHKGKGYSFAEKDETGYWHGVSPFNIESGEPKETHDGYLSWSHVFSDLSDEILEKNQKTILITPATEKGSGLEGLAKKYGERFIDVGISEEHAVTLASGLSLNGYHPIISIYSTFLQRTYDQISHDLARMKLPVTFLIDRAGFVGSDGETHQGLYDVAFLKSIPHVIITMPSTLEEAKALYYQSLGDFGGPFFIRLPRALVKKQDKIEDINLPFGKWKVLKNSSDLEIAVIGIGPLGNCLYQNIIQNNIDATFINPIYLNIFDDEVMEFIVKHKNIIVYDPYSTEHGFVESFKAKLNELHYQNNLYSFACPNNFIKHASICEQIKDNKLDVIDVINKIKQIKR